MRTNRSSQLSMALAALLFSACLGGKQKVVPNTPQTKAKEALNAAVKLHDEGKYAEAKPKIAEALALDPNLAKAYNLLGLESLAENKPEEAKVHFTKARELDKNNAEAALGLGNAYAQNGEYDKAEPLLTEAVKLSKEAAESPTKQTNISRASYFLAELYTKEGKLDLAAASYQESIKQGPDNLWPKLGLSRLLRRSNPDEAKKLAEEASALNEKLDEPYHQLGILASDQKDYATAEVQFAKAVEKNDKLPRNYMNLGTVQSYQGKLDAAKTSFEKAIERDPKYALAYNNLGHVQRLAGRNEESITAAKKAVELDNQVPLYQVNLGDTYAAMGKFAEAAKSYQAALALAPNEAPLLRKLSLALAQSGDTPGAYKALSDFIEKNPSSEATPALKEELTRIAKEELKNQLR